MVNDWMNSFLILVEETFARLAGYSITQVKNTDNDANFYHGCKVFKV